MEWRIPLADIDFGPEEEEAVLQVIKSRWLTMGAVTQTFEEEFAAYVGSRHAIAVANGTAALHLACLAAGLRAGDEVIVPSLTFVATANAVRYTGAKPVFADIAGEHDLNMPPATIEPCLTPWTRAVIVMHYGGYPCDMPGILELAKAHDLVVIEDAAHAVGSRLDERMLGTWGSIGCFSFFSNKNMTTGEGGMLVTDDDAMAGKLHALRSHGMTALTWDRHQGHAWSYDVVALGYNYRLDEIRAALGRVQLGRLEHNNDRRRQLTRLYRERLQELTPSISIPFKDHRGTCAHHLMPILLPAGTDRTAFMEQMKARGVQTSIHYPPIHKFSAYRNMNTQMPANLGVTEEVATREVTLPLYPALTEADVELVTRSVLESLMHVTS